MNTRRFGKTTINRAWSPANRAWLVWRDDAGRQSGVRLFNDQAESFINWRDRGDFLAAVLALSGEIDDA